MGVTVIAYIMLDYNVTWCYILKKLDERIPFKFA